MKGSNTILINGRTYDAITGLPVASTPSKRPGAVFSDIGPHRAGVSKPKSSARPAGTTHTSVHARLQHSQTLMRTGVKAPKVDTPQSNIIRHFAPHPVGNRPTASGPKNFSRVTTIKPVPVAKKPATVSRKEQLIAQRIAEAEARKSQPRVKKSRLRAFVARKPRFVSIATASLALLLLGGYLTYLNLPNLSVRVAAAHAGINATYPEYRPDGYSLNGPVAYAPGEVTLSFRSNTNSTQAYTIKQRASSWDSQAVLDYVSKAANNQPTTYSSHGLTIYTYDTNAAWVNGGILYTINGNAPLSSDQIVRIADSL